MRDNGAEKMYSLAAASSELVSENEMAAVAYAVAVACDSTPDPNDVELVAQELRRLRITEGLWDLVFKGHVVPKIIDGIVVYIPLAKPDPNVAKIVKLGIVPPSDTER